VWVAARSALMTRMEGWAAEDFGGSHGNEEAGACGATFFYYRTPNTVLLSKDFNVVLLPYKILMPSNSFVAPLIIVNA
jgi:hypothetical protein